MAWYNEGSLATLQSGFDGSSRGLSQQQLHYPGNGRFLDVRGTAADLSPVTELAGNREAVTKPWWLTLARKYVLLCWLCGGLIFILGLFFLLIWLLLRAHTSSLIYFQTVPSYVPACVMMVTGLLIISFIKRKNRFNFLIRLAGFCCLLSAILCVVVTIATTVIHMSRLQLLTECVYAKSLGSCTCFAGRLPPLSDGSEVSFVFNGVANCESIHGILYSCLRGLFGVSVVGILMCLFSAMLIYQLICHERKRQYREQLDIRRRRFFANQRPFPPSFCHSEPWNNCTLLDSIQWWPHSVSTIQVENIGGAAISDMSLLGGRSGGDGHLTGCFNWISKLPFIHYSRARNSNENSGRSRCGTATSALAGSVLADTVSSSGVNMRRSCRSNNAVFQHLAASQQARYSCPPLLAPLWQRWEPPPPYTQPEQSAFQPVQAVGSQTESVTAACPSDVLQEHAAVSACCATDRNLSTVFRDDSQRKSESQPAHSIATCQSSTVSDEGNAHNLRLPQQNPSDDQFSHKKEQQSCEDLNILQLSADNLNPILASASPFKMQLRTSSIPKTALHYAARKSGQLSLNNFTTSTSSCADSCSTWPPNSSQTSDGRQNCSEIISSQLDSSQISNGDGMTLKNYTKSLDRPMDSSKMTMNSIFICAGSSKKNRFELSRKTKHRKCGQVHYFPERKYCSGVHISGIEDSTSDFIPNHVLPKSTASRSFPAEAVVHPARMTSFKLKEARGKNCITRGEKFRHCHSLTLFSSGSDTALYTKQQLLLRPSRVIYHGKHEGAPSLPDDLSSVSALSSSVFDSSQISVSTSGSQTLSSDGHDCVRLNVETALSGRMNSNLGCPMSAPTYKDRSESSHTSNQLLGSSYLSDDDDTISDRAINIYHGPACELQLAAISQSLPSSPFKSSSLSMKNLFRCVHTVSQDLNR